MSPRQFAFFVGLATLAAAAFLLFLPVHATADGVSASCGSVSSGSGGDAQRVGNVADLTAAMEGRTSTTGNDLAAACADSMSTRQAWALPVLGIGLVVTIGSKVVRGSGQPPRESLR